MLNPINPSSVKLDKGTADYLEDSELLNYWIATAMAVNNCWPIYVTTSSALT